jgi:hypothetical protein
MTSIRLILSASLFQLLFTGRIEERPQRCAADVRAMTYMRTTVLVF